jgi:hypothetical protein
MKEARMPPRFSETGPFVEHPLEKLFNATGWDILSAIAKGFRAQGDVKGKLSEWFLYKQLIDLKDSGVIEDVIWHDKDGRPDFDIVIGGRTIRMECKNVRSGPNPREYQGDYRVEIQKTRHQLVGDKKLRGYRVTSWDVLAACLFNQTGTWTYLFVETARLPRLEEFPDYLVIMQRVPPSPRGVWKGTLIEVLNELAPEAEG